ncbi:vitamin K epoxide reductase family protein [Bacteroides gallinaceum]|uniref:vitamin K epoxide reductase family protein n=1 Tax=Bacteroides gallinaceum TaxID=1462571 RepID=UPI0025A3CC52|nr:vitamin K epoxide reductase family protein [Bacteroides gallinaceum]MDM8206686.1 vitamin K epoxide reductase family protein [Bacteroides gallinaceum]
MSTNIFISILRELHVSFTKSFTLRAYEEHPYKYTFFGLKSLCERYGIEAKGLFLCDKRSILNLSLPFVAYFNNDYALVKKIDGERIVFEMYGSDNQLLLTDFINDCSGHVLIFKSNEKSIEPNYKQHLFNKWFSYVEYLCLAISAAVLLSIFMAGRPIPTCIEFILMLLSLLGCFLSGMLITQQMKVHNSLAESVCHVFKESSCNNVLESSAAKFLGRYSWAEIGFSYFFVNLIGLMILSNSQESLAYVAALSLLYSI